MFRTIEKSIAPDAGGEENIEFVDTTECMQTHSGNWTNDYIVVQTFSKIKTFTFRSMQLMKRKERDFEHEMDRLTREKIAKQQRIENLRLELSAHIDNFDSTIILTDGEIGSGIRERGMYNISFA